MPRSRFPKICFDRILDSELRSTPAAPPAHPAFPGAPMPFEIAVLTNKLWEVGRSLRVRFIDGDPRVQAKVEQVAHTWEQYVNLKLVFGDDPDAEIRISFSASPGSWSYMGKDCLTIPKSQPTMNYGWLQLNTHNDEYNRVVLHEFGHALGAIHEHQSPAAGIPWNKDAVYRYYMGPPNNWTRAQVDLNLFQKYSETITQFSAFDEKSIMLYPIPRTLTTGGYEVGWNTDLSDTDKNFMGTIYPFESRPANQLVIGGPPLETDIGAHGEVDEFTFVVAAQGRYTIETGGPTDVLLDVFGPDDPDLLAGHDDDSGQGFNARIVKDLTPGKYFARVRHYRPRGLGKYTIQVKTGG